MLLGGVTEEQTASRQVVVGVIVCSVLDIEVAPFTGGMTIEQASDHRLWDGGRDSGSGDDAAEGMAHRWKS